MSAITCLAAEQFINRDALIIAIDDVNKLLGDDAIAVSDDRPTIELSNEFVGKGSRLPDETFNNVSDETFDLYDFLAAPPAEQRRVIPADTTTPQRGGSNVNRYANPSGTMYVKMLVCDNPAITVDMIKEALSKRGFSLKESSIRTAMTDTHVILDYLALKEKTPVADEQKEGVSDA